MPRANHYFLPGYIRHITHRCHKKEYLWSESLAVGNEANVDEVHALLGYRARKRKKW
jgi:hypothetical protein